jgi:hypothetical protein
VRRLLADQAPLVVFLAAVAAGALAYLAVTFILARHRLLADARAFARAQSDPATPAADEEIVTPAQAEAALSPAG